MAGSLADREPSRASEAPTERLGSDAAGLDRAAELLRAGGLVAIPTETVYGLAADAESEPAVRAIFAAKGRPPDQPLIVHVRPRWADRYAARWSRTAATLAEAFWPGPLTVVVARSERVPDAVTGGLGTVGLRAPSHPVAAELLDRYGSGLAAPSANRYGHVSPTTAEHVLDDLDGRIDAVVDGGSCPVGVESTIVELADDGSILLLRRGAITEEQLQRVAGVAPLDRTAGPVRAPGMVASHYAPAAPVAVIDQAELDRRRRNGLAPSVLVICPFPVDHARTIVLGSDDRDYAAGLYDALRHGDDPSVSAVLVIPPARGAMAPAISDRLARAAHPERPAVWP